MEEGVHSRVEALLRGFGDEGHSVRLGETGRVAGFRIAGMPSYKTSGPRGRRACLVFW